MVKRDVHIAAIVLSLCLSINVAGAQSFYYSGSFIDRQGRPVAFVNIKPFQSPIVYQAGNSGEFGISSFHKNDSAWCYLVGFDSLLVVLQHGMKHQFILDMEPSYAEKLIRASRLSSLTRLPPGFVPSDKSIYEETGESYHLLVENQWNPTRQAPFTGFVPNSNKSSYANIRRFVRQGSRVPPNAIRVEELWNYFSLHLQAAPSPQEPFTLSSVLTECPWNAAHRLVIINAVARKVAIDSLPPVNMVFLIDNSGSMEEANRLPLLKAGFKKMIEHLRPTDRVGIVTYGGSAGIYLPPTFGTEKVKIQEALDSIEAGGSTPGANGIQLAYELVTTNPFTNGINKVILATDGDFNVGLSNESELETLIGRYRSTGVTLSCVGVGMGNYKDSKIEVLSRLGNGSFAYLDTDDEAEKAMLLQLGESLFTIARDVTIQFGFEENAVKQYKLIGYENKLEALKVVPQQLVGTEAGSGQCIIGMAELELADSTLVLAEAPGFFELQYSLPDTNAITRQTRELPMQIIPLKNADSTVKRAVALAWLAHMLKSNKVFGNTTLAGVEELVAQSSHSPAGIPDELLTLVRQIRQVYEPAESPRRKGKKEKAKDRE